MAAVTITENLNKFLLQALDKARLFMYIIYAKDQDNIPTCTCFNELKENNLNYIRTALLAPLAVKQTQTYAVGVADPKLAVGDKVLYSKHSCKAVILAVAQDTDNAAGDLFLLFSTLDNPVRFRNNANPVIKINLDFGDK